MANDWTEARRELDTALATLAVSSGNGLEMAADAGFTRWRELADRVRDNDRTVYLIGNGASASMASHFSADIAKNALVRTQVFTDLSQITAIGNDLEFRQIYALPLRNYSRPGDLLVAISSSGASPNILEAVRVARERGVSVVTLSGFRGDNPLRQMGDLNFYVPAADYGLAETAHAAILHYWMDLLAAGLKHS